MKFGTILADPPWNYGKPTKTREESDGTRWRRDSNGKAYYLTGYSSIDEYPPMTTERLCELPVADVARDDSLLLLWTTFPFISDALQVIEAWEFTYVTGMTWVKLAHSAQDGETPKKLSYGVGYWFRGAAELILLGRRKNTRACRTNYVGLMSENFTHSRKPDDLHALAEEYFPGPYLELFGRRPKDGWTVIGNEAPDHEGEDIQESLLKLAPLLDHNGARMG